MCGMKFDFNHYLQKIGEIGFVERVVSSLIYTDGLPGAKPDELVVAESGDLGVVTALRDSGLEILSLSKNPIRVGMRLARTDRVIEVPVGKGLLGKIINPLGHSLDPSRPVPPLEESRPIDTIPSGINVRSRIKRSCETGVAMVDFLVPLGKGQRELIIGDQKTGKTRFLLRALLAQVKEGAVGIYAMIGKGQMTIKEIERFLEEMRILDKVILVVSSADDPAGVIYLTPYAAMAIAEYFRDLGRDVLLVLDDLTVHAKIYREIALLGRRYPGRNSYPGDIFYTHARLLERAGNFVTPRGESSITCLPVVEALQGDLTGYIQTNTMSMTDGHILFDRLLFAEGRRPAVDPFLSVTRVGFQTQSALKLEIGRTLLAFLRSVEKLHNFTSFGSELGEHIKRALHKEERILKFFDQTVYDHLPSSLQLFLFGMVWSERWVDNTPQEIGRQIQKIIYSYQTRPEIQRNVGLAVSDVKTIAGLLERVKIADALKL